MFPFLALSIIKFLPTGNLYFTNNQERDISDNIDITDTVFL